VTDVAAHTAPAGDAAIVTLAGTAGLTDMVIAFDVAGFGDAHDILEVISTVTISPFTRVDDVKVLLFVPAFMPFTFH